MAFQQKSLQMRRDGACLTNGEMGYDDSSKSEAKRGHQWFMDAAAPELFSNKKQAMESLNSCPVSRIADASVSPWSNASCFQSASGPFGDHLFGSEPIRTANMVDRNISSTDTGNMSMGRKDFEDQYSISSSSGLSMSHTTEDASSFLSFGGIRKVKVNQVRDSNSGMPVLMGHPYRGVNSTFSVSNVFSKNDNAISLGPTYGSEDENTISMGPTFSNADGNFISIGHTFIKRAGDFIPVGHNYKGNESTLSMGQPFDKEDGNFIPIGQSYEKGDANLISLSPFYGKGQENFISMASEYSKPNESVVSMASSFDKEGDNIIPMGPSYHKADCNITAVAPKQDKGGSNILSMHQNYNRCERNTISFGGFHDEPEANLSGSIISCYDLLMNNQNSAQASEAPCQQVLVKSNSTDSNVNSASKSSFTIDTNLKHKETVTSKKVSPNNFPSNVKSLLSTGMLDGVVVKYVSWSREKNLKGYIQGTGYMCGCNDCKFEKALNAYEFERHASCKTKHPNNHIYFENGKTIYAVVQELKNTPQELLFDAIQTVTGSQINQKNFRIWKASYQAATRELQRIYGKDDAVVSSLR
ncbi:uncharacterized protein LOC120219159 [Hibiscus syriacus]|uniref:uncharacterized protein LOC120219159 n=1 Tax=Hibiscus syriacus TaxID=106335 RepID=UPI001924A7F0|nr:uncharacterized protein LOC120219159 [Hibiscus syriacus]